MLARDTRGFSLKLPRGENVGEANTEIGLLQVAIAQVRDSLRAAGVFNDAAQSNIVGARRVSTDSRQQILQVAAELKRLGELGQAIESAFTTR